MINLNDGNYVKGSSTPIFNDGKAGIVENVTVRIEKKSDMDSKMPDYKLIASDGKGEINEGFYYQEPGSAAFDNYQAQKLIWLARGVLGDNITFPVYETPAEALDGIMKMVAPHLKNKRFRVAVTFGTTKKSSAFLMFKAFGPFIQPMNVPNTLRFSSTDRLERPQQTLTSDADVKKQMNMGDVDWSITSSSNKKNSDEMPF